VENSLLMRTEASSTLNFLVYIQNVFLNQNCNEEEYRFPYIPLKIAFNEKFELHYKELWDMVSQRISDNPMNDMKIFTDEKDLFYRSLFMDSGDSIKRYSEIYQSFKIWWDSFAGRFSIENSISEKGQKLYKDLANSLIQKGSLPQKELNISLVFDECPLGNLEVSSYCAVVPIKDFIVNYKQLLFKLSGTISK
jgi:L-rhamnose mutarotase